MKFFILLLMIFLHIVDDFHFQTNSFLAKGKQKSWWEKHAPDDMYKNDYLVSLFFHSFTWAFMIMLPIFIQDHFVITPINFLVFIVNLTLHMIIDDLKANRKKLNLLQDQTLHLEQIIFTWLAMVVL